MWTKSCALILAMMVPGAVLAQPKPRDSREVVEDKVRERVRALRTSRIIEYLNLDEKTTMRLMPIVNKTYDEIGAVARDSGYARRELRDLVTQGSQDAARMNALVDKLLANRQKMARLEEDGFRQARAVLNPTQAATFVLILPEINRGIERQIRRAARPHKERAPGRDSDDLDPPF